MKEFCSQNPVKNRACGSALGVLGAAGVVLAVNRAWPCTGALFRPSQDLPEVLLFLSRIAMNLSFLK